MDDLMRHPSQAPAPAKKTILRKGSGAVLRCHTKPNAAIHHSPRPATVPARGGDLTAAAVEQLPARATTAHAGTPRDACLAGRPLDWREGLKQFIAGQREGSQPAQVAQQVCVRLHSVPQASAGCTS